MGSVFKNVRGVCGGKFPAEMVICAGDLTAGKNHHCGKMEICEKIFVRTEYSLFNAVIICASFVGGQKSRSKIAFVRDFHLPHKMLPLVQNPA